MKKKLKKHATTKTSSHSEQKKTGANKIGSPQRAKTLKVFEHDIDDRTFISLCKKDLLSIDTETGGLDPREHPLLLVQICTDDSRVYFIRRPNHLSFRLLSLFEQKYITWIFHHAMFDLRFLLAGTGKKINGKIECTKTLMKIVHPELKSGLAAALREVRKVILKKGIRHEWDVETLSKEQINYASGDVLELHGLFRNLQIDMTPENFSVYRRAMKAIQQIAELEIEGYTDLFTYEQNNLEKTLKQRNWWIQRPLSRITF